MNTRGQFSIIAALLVAVVLISTLILTYSTIRNFPTGGQPQVLNAIDETNLALKQVLGFTVGYYGSVLQITGNVDYANASACKYLVSGLNYISKIHPEWALSFNLKKVDLEAYWFTGQSYSRGSITVEYNITGLGIYGISYATSCKLTVNVLGAVDNQAYISVTVDEKNEPLVNLGKSNFKFYVYTNSSWTTTTSTKDPAAFKNGTYLIELPLGIDPYSYMVQVEDQRGIITVASSYNRYVCGLAWNFPFAEQEDYVDQISNVDGVPDIGTHSNFTAMQGGPDGIFNRLTEVNIGGISTTLIKSPSLTTGGTWTYPTNAYEDNSNYAYVTSGTPSGAQTYSKYGFNIPSGAVINQVKVRYDAWSPHNIITFVGTGSKASGGTSEVQVPLPSNIAVGDICILVATTVPAATVTITNSGGGSWTALPGTPVNVMGGEKLYVWWRRHASGDSAPYVKASNDHVCAGIAAWRGCTATGSPIDVYPQTGTETWSDTSFGFATTVSTTVDGCMVIAICTSGADTNDAQFSGWANAQLSNVAERMDYFTNTTGGGGFGLAEGYKAFAGAVGTWSATLANASPKAYISFALKPSVGDEQIKVDVSWDGGTSWSTKQATSLNGTETTYWYDVTSATSWTPEKLTDENFRVRVEAYTTGMAGQVRLDWIPVEVTYTINYKLDLEVQWINVNYADRLHYLCIKTGELSSEKLIVDVRNGSSWVTVINALQPNAWNNVSVSEYVNSPTFTIRFRGDNDVSDVAQDSWDIDAVLLRYNRGVELPSQDATFVIELLQNGTMRWLGQNLILTTPNKPVPPVPIKAIRVNQTINGVDCEVPFQIEDWASDYHIPLGLANNASVFNNRNMLVFLANTSVSKVTIWWNGSDRVKQTPYAYVNRYFDDKPPTDSSEIGALSNGRLNLTIDASSSQFVVKSKINNPASIETTANFMRINQKWAIYGSNPAYTIYNGVVRDIVHAEAEWSGGIPGCPNVYSHIVLTLPASATYYTYQLRLMFIESPDKPRNIADICPIKISTMSTSTFSALTENGTLSSGYPNVSVDSGLFYNMSNIWQHQWSQLNSTNKSGFGIISTINANIMLYIFDDIAQSKTGSIKVNSTEKAIEILPVSSSLAQVENFADALNTCWYGAVVTFHDTEPIYIEYATPNGLWLIAEYPPTVTVTTET